MAPRASTIWSRLAPNNSLTAGMINSNRSSIGSTSRDGSNQKLAMATVIKMSGKIVKTRNITQTAEGKRGMWTTVVAAAVFILR